MPRGGGQDLPPRRNALLGEGIPTRRTSEKICPAQECSPRRRHPDTAHEQKNLPPREKAPLGESLPTRRTSERICPAQERSPRRKHPDTAHERRDLPRAGIRPAAKASRHGAKAKGFVPRGFAFAPHADERRAAPDRRTAGKTHLRRGRTRDGARAKGFAPRRNAPHGKGLPTRRTSQRICPRRNSPHGEGLPTRRTSQRICPAGFALAPRADERRAALDRRTAEKHPFGGVAPERARPLPSSFTEKNKTTP